VPKRLELKIDDSGVFVDVRDAHNMPITVLSADVEVLVALAEEALKRTGEAEVDACCVANLVCGDLRCVSVKIFDMQFRHRRFAAYAQRSGFGNLSALMKSQRVANNINVAGGSC
jgi:hypothetical protein